MGMPICRTCRGEYTYQECLCPSCHEPLGRGVNLCHHCGADTRGRRLCPRCKSDVRAWERENFPFHQFISRWGALGVLPSLAALGFWLLFWAQRMPSLHHPMMTLFAVAMSQVVLILLYIKRLFWRERWWASQIYRTRNMPLTASIAGTFVAGSLLGGVSFVLYKLWPNLTPDGKAWAKMGFGIAYALMYVFFTGTFTLVALQDYMDRLDERVPQPLFVHTDHLLRVVVDAAIQNLNILNGKQVRALPEKKGPQRSYEVLEVVRNPDDGGVRVSLREFKQTAQLAGNSEVRVQWVERIWHIEADMWGRIRVLEPGKSVSQS